MRPPLHPVLTCSDPASSDCDRKVDAARLLDHERVLQRYADYVEATCELHDEPRWPN